jgi:hypothetical protein
MNQDNQSRRSNRQPKLNMIQIQQRYIERINAAFDRWSYRPKPSWQKAGGHYGRAHRAARREAVRALFAWGFSEEQANLTIRQADDMAELERDSR